MKALAAHILCGILFLAVTHAWEPNGRFFSGNYDMRMAGRPDGIYPRLQNANEALTRQGEGPAYVVELSRHHIIPRSTLTAFFNNLVFRGDAVYFHYALNSLADRISVFYHDVVGTCSNSGTSILDAVNLIFSIAYRLVRQDERASSAPGLDYLQAYFAWLPGNLFIGPSSRQDDPGDNFEENAYVIIGRDRHDNLREIYNLMTTYNRGTNINLEDLASRLRRVINNYRDPFALDHRHWSRNGTTGKYYINTSSRVARALEILNVSQTSIGDETCDKLSSVYDSLETKLIVIIL